MGTAIFIAELTDKDALLILSLATRLSPSLVFVAGSVAFTITSAIIVTLGHFLISYVPTSYVSLAGGTIMIGYGIWGLLHTEDDQREAQELETRLTTKMGKGLVSVFASAVALLVLLDLAGDATEVLTIVFVARFRKPIIVFVGAVLALVAATAVETTLGNTLGRLIPPNRMRLFSSCIFLTIGAALTLSMILQM